MVLDAWRRRIDPGTEAVRQLVYSLASPSAYPREAYKTDSGQQCTTVAIHTGLGIMWSDYVFSSGRVENEQRRR